MTPIPLPKIQRRRRDAIFAVAWRRILVLTNQILIAQPVDIEPNDPDLSVRDLAADALLGAFVAYEGLYWSDPEAFAAKTDAYLSAFIVQCAQISIMDEIDRVLDERAFAEDEPLSIGSFYWPAATGFIPGFSIIQAA